METSDSGVQGRVKLHPPPPGSEPGPECEHRFMFPRTSRLILGLHLRRAGTRPKEELHQPLDHHKALTDSPVSWCP